MSQMLLLKLLPYFLGVVFSLVALRILISLAGVRFKFSHLKQLHADQQGGVQSLTFVLTLPLFIMIMMFIVQLSQIMIATVDVEYAAFAAARSAIVWIPARTEFPDETENRISSYTFVGMADGPDGPYARYVITPEGPKFEKIHFAAAMACMPASPSRSTEIGFDHPGNAGLPAVIRGYQAVAPSQAGNTRVPQRLRNKLAYALDRTDVRIEVWHKDAEPPLETWFVSPYRDEFAYNEIGWQDQIHVTVRHHMALLPGPGRLLAGQARVDRASRNGGQDSGYSNGDRDPQQQQDGDNDNNNNDNNNNDNNNNDNDNDGQNNDNQGNGSAFEDRIQGYQGVYTWALQSTVRLTNEGDKPSYPYMQFISSDVDDEDFSRYPRLPEIVPDNR